MLSYNQLTHRRTSYNLLLLFGDIGGIGRALTFIFSLLLIGYSDFSFKMKAIEKLYIAKTKETGIIEKEA